MVLRLSGRGPPYPVWSPGTTAGCHGDKEHHKVVRSWGHGVMGQRGVLTFHFIHIHTHIGNYVRNSGHPHGNKTHNLAGVPKDTVLAKHTHTQ